MTSNNLHFDLSHFSIIQVSGEDASEFLENQLITHLPDLQQTGWLLSAWCLPNGRILSNFIIFQYNSNYFLILPSMLKQKIIDRFKMYVLRSKVEIEDVSENFALLGIYGEKYLDIFATNTEFNSNKRLQLVDESILLQMHENTHRWMLLVPIEKINHFMNQILMTSKESDRSTWSLLDIESGLPWITEPTSEQFLPQMLNLDQTGGLSYKKGCYPGQEIIARIHFRGEIKKRLYLGTGKSEITPGPGDQLETIDSKKLVGDIIDAESSANDQFSFLAAVDTNISEAVQIRGSENTAINLKPVE